MSDQQRQRLLTFVAIGSIAAFAADSLVITPLYKSWKARAGKIAELRKSVSKGEQVLDRESALTSRWKSMHSNSLTDEKSVAQSKALKKFDQWAQDSRLANFNIRPQWRRNSDEYSTLELTMDASGSMSGVTRFLHQLEKDPMALRIESLELTGRDTEGQQIMLTLSVSALCLEAEGEKGLP